MRAAVMAEGGAFEVTAVEDPVPRAGELLLHVSACGLCGSDLKARPAMPAGVIMGHEFGGQVVGVGPATEGWAEGMHAAVLPVASCGSCGHCRSGDVAHCASAGYLGLGGGPGGFAELAVVPAASAFPVPLPIEAVHAALVEPYAVGLHTVEAAGIEEGDSVLVVGAGTVGLTSLTWARRRGAARVTVADPNEARRANAASFGATDSLASAADAEPGTYDVAIECVGKPGLLDACIVATRVKGRIAVAGVCTEQDPFWSMAALMKELTVHFAVYYTPAEFEAVIEAFGSGTIEPARLVGRTIPLGDLAEAFDVLAAGSTPGKILIDPT
jgi:(R,R)-butanediol dehydrogenase / meso-butanediol dehydrogenase / diacetyl reductase